MRAHRYSSQSILLVFDLFLFLSVVGFPFCLFFDTHNDEWTYLFYNFQLCSRDLCMFKCCCAWAIMAKCFYWVALLFARTTSCHSSTFSRSKIDTTHQIPQYQWNFNWIFVTKTKFLQFALDHLFNNGKISTLFLKVRKFDRFVGEISKISRGSERVVGEIPRICKDRYFKYSFISRFRLISTNYFVKTLK